MRSLVALALASCVVVIDHQHHASEWARCDVPSDCVLALDGCCGGCGEPQVGDFDAVNVGWLDVHRADVCPSPVPCPLCPTVVNPDLLATCTAGLCRAVDVRDESATACATDDDCRLRTPECCECGGTTEPASLVAIAVSGEGSYERLVCDPGQLCAMCLPMYPDSVEAYCAADGHCAVRQVAACAAGLTRCDSGCAATYDDVFNCGTCGNVCSGEHPFCDGTACAETPPCWVDMACPSSTFCCGARCCADDQLCCDVPGPGPAMLAECVTPDASGTCPVGCPLCE